MTKERPMRVLSDRRTHENDPDEATGVFGNEDCMGHVRAWGFSAVIGVGGIKPWSDFKHIACKITWIGIGARTFEPDWIKKAKYRGPLVAFDHFKYCYDADQKLLKEIAPMLARHMYEEYKCARAPLLVGESSQFWPEVKGILDLAKNAPPSAHFRGVPPGNLQETGRKCRPSSFHNPK